MTDPTKKSSPCSPFAPGIGYLPTGLAFVALSLSLFLGINFVPPTAEAQVGASVLRSQTRAISRPIAQQARQAIKPNLTIRSGALASVDILQSAPGNRFVAMTASDGSIRIWDMTLGAQVVHLAKENLPARNFKSLAISDDGRVMLALTEGGKLVGWRLDSDEPESADLLPINGVRAVVSLEADPPVLAVLAGDKLFFTDEDFSFAQESKLPFDATLLAADGRGGLLLADGQGRVSRYSNNDGEWQQTASWSLPAQASVLKALAAPDNSFRLLAGLTNGRVLLLPEDSEGPLWNLRPTRGRVEGLVRLSDGLLAVLSGGRVNFIDIEQGRRQGRELRLPFSGAASGIAGAPGGRLLVSGSGGRVLAVDPASRESLVTIYLTQTSWAVLDSDGRYDGTADSARDVAWEMDGELHDLERFMSSYFEPGLAARRLAAESSVITSPERTQEEGFYPPPEVSLTLVGHNQENARVRVEASLRGGLVEGETPVLRLFRNGRRVAGDEGLSPEKDDSGERLRLSWEAEVPLQSGENSIQASVLSWAKLESRSESVSIEITRPQPVKPRLIVSGVGINEYADESLWLDFAVPDAKAVVEALASTGETRTEDWAGNVTYLHLDHQAGKHDLAEHFKYLRSTRPEDTVIIFLAGHAKAVGESWYFLPVEAAGLRSEAHIREVGFSSAAMAEALVQVPAGTIVLVIDACNSGAAIDAFDGFAQRRAISGLSSEAGITVMAATRADQLALEFDILGHGLFTYTMLRGLSKGDDGYYHADRWPRDGRVMIGELRKFVETFMPILAARLEREIAAERGVISDRTTVTPALTDVTNDFPLR